jgi:hypothetical protein
MNVVKFSGTIGRIKYWVENQRFRDRLDFHHHNQSLAKEIIKALAINLLFTRLISRGDFGASDIMYYSELGCLLHDTFM